MRSRFVVVSFVLAVALLGLAQPAAAQEFTGEVSFGFSFLGSDGIAINADTLPVGWSGGGAYRVSDNVSIAFDLSGQFKSGIDVCGGIESATLPLSQQPVNCLVGIVPATADVEFQGLSFHRPESQWCSPTLETCSVNAISVGFFAGPRFELQVGKVKPFVHIMGGAVRVVRQIEFFSHTATNFAIMPGGGIDVDVTDNTAIRFQGDYRRVFFPDPADSNSTFVTQDGADFNEFRFNIGLVFKLGGR